MLYLLDQLDANIPSKQGCMVEKIFKMSLTRIFEGKKSNFHGNHGQQQVAVGEKEVSSQPSWSLQMGYERERKSDGNCSTKNKFGP